MPRSFAQPAPLVGKPTEPRSALPHIAFVLALPQGDMQPFDVQSALLPVCYHITERTKCVSATTALLDLGICHADEAHAALRDLQQSLVQQGYVVSIGIGSSCVLAQLALLTAEARLAQQGIIHTIPPESVGSIPTRSLLLLHPRGAITSAIVERLQRYGLRTLGHIARLTEVQLRRQFGDTTGTTLFALAQGLDLHPLTPTPPPHRITLRFRLPMPLPPSHLLALMPTIGAHLSAQLQQEQCAQGLSMQVRWEHGARTSARVTLRQPTAEASQLTTDLQRLLSSLIPNGQPNGDAVDAVDGLWVTLEDVAPLHPTQRALWHEREAHLRHRTALHAIANTLTLRHHRPLLWQARLVTPDAIFAEDRYALADVSAAGMAASAGAARPPLRGAVAQQAANRELHTLGAVADVADTTDAWQTVPQRLHWW